MDEKFIQLSREYEKLKKEQAMWDRIERTLLIISCIFNSLVVIYLYNQLYP